MPRRMCDGRCVNGIRFAASRLLESDAFDKLFGNCVLKQMIIEQLKTIENVLGAKLALVRGGGVPT